MYYVVKHTECTVHLMYEIESNVYWTMHHCNS